MHTPCFRTCIVCEKSQRHYPLHYQVDSLSQWERFLKRASNKIEKFNKKELERNCKVTSKKVPSTPSKLLHFCMIFSPVLSRLFLQVSSKCSVPRWILLKFYTAFSQLINTFSVGFTSRSFPALSYKYILSSLFLKKVAIRIPFPHLGPSQFSFLEFSSQFHHNPFTTFYIRHLNE